MSIKSEERVFPDGLRINGVDEFLNAKRKLGTFSVSGGVFGNGDGSYIGIIRVHLPGGSYITMESKKPVTSLDVARQELDEQMQIILRQVEEAKQKADALADACECDNCKPFREVLSREIGTNTSTDRTVH